MTQLPKNNDELIASFPLFQYHLKYSPALRRSINNILMGLGLPCLRGRRQEHWGYKDHPTIRHVRLPIEEDIKFFAQAQVMAECKEFYHDDVIAWLNKCPLQSPPMAVSTFYYIIKNRPTFPECLHPWEQRVRLLYDGYAGKFTSFASPSQKKKVRTTYGDGEEEARGTEEEEGSGIHCESRQAGCEEEAAGGREEEGGTA